jgi:parallel beta-helix repeat protein
VLVTGNICHQNKDSGIAIVTSAHVLVQSNACYANTNGIRLAGSTDPGRNLIGANMLYNGTDLKR